MALSKRDTRVRCSRKLEASSKCRTLSRQTFTASSLLGPRARIALPQLRPLLGSEDPPLKGLAEWAIGKIEVQVA